METNFSLILFSLGFVIGIFSGLLGIGGGVLLIPSLLYLFPLLSLPTFAMKQITGIAVMQGVAGSASASFIHYKNGNMDLNFVMFVGVGSMAGSYLGGYTSQFYPDALLKAIFIGVLVFILVFSVYSPKPALDDGMDTIPRDRRSSWLFWFLALGVGYVSGLLGIGGAVFLVPILYSLMRIPVRLAIGTGAGVVLLTSIASFIGKWQMGQIPLEAAMLITAGAVIGAAVGAKIFHRVPVKALKVVFFVVILASLLRALWEFVG